MAAQEGTPRNSALAVRGNPHQRDQITERAQITALGKPIQINELSSGRQELAHRLVHSNYALTARVIVNRVWQHLLGRGLVHSPDNLGVLGGRPSHPKLLDYLAVELIEHEWSLKWLIREIVMSKTYQLSASPTLEQRVKDPDGALLSHRRVRRLSAEALRDALLATSNSLDFRIAGPSVPIHLNNQMTGRGRPGKSGPIDGNGRRSSFIEIRRNFLDPFLLAFDFPMPSTTAGSRSSSNVPAQALGLLNDPLVSELVARWTTRVTVSDPERRIRQMIATAFSRRATDTEVAQCMEFVQEHGDDSWQALAHVLINSKEFSYLR